MKKFNRLLKNKKQFTYILSKAKISPKSYNFLIEKYLNKSVNNLRKWFENTSLNNLLLNKFICFIYTNRRINNFNFIYIYVFNYF